MRSICRGSLPQVREQPREKITDGRTPVVADRAGQCHVEAELLEYIGEAPSFELRPLARVQAGFPARPVAGTQRRTEIVEHGDAFGGEPIEHGVALARDDGNEPA